MNQKPLVIYHKNCLDGFAAAWCFHHLEADGFEFYAASYNKPPPDVKGRFVYIVDFSYPRDVTEQMLETAAFIVILDHHESAITRLSDLEHSNLYKVLDKTKSGAMLAWDFCFWTQAPKVLEHIQDRDLWLFKLPNTRQIAAVVALGGFSFEAYDKLMLDPDLDRMIIEGFVLEKQQQKAVKDLSELCTRPMNIGGYIVPCANVPPMFASDMGNLLSKDEPFAATYFDTNHSRMFSLRSSPQGINVAKIAEHYGGGGHEHAAGFKVDRDHRLAKE
jgi:oligoribonuclease NrnB/cAMP/cGMP phosphodiesterase (DHH superfamily)